MNLRDPDPHSFIRNACAMDKLRARFASVRAAELVVIVVQVLAAVAVVRHVMRMERLYNFYFTGDAEAVVVGGALFGCVMFAFGCAWVSSSVTRNDIRPLVVRYAVCLLALVLWLHSFESAVSSALAGPDVSGFSAELPSDLKTYVLTINGSVSVARQISVETQLRRENVRFEYFYGVLFKNYPDVDSVVRATGYTPVPDLTRFVETYNQYIGKKLSFGDVGAEYVMFKKLRDVYESRDEGDNSMWVMLMEDDVELYPDFTRRVNYALQRWPSVDVIYLDDRGWDTWLLGYPACGFGATLFKIPSIPRLIHAMSPDSEETLRIIRRRESFVNDRRLGQACRDGQLTCGFTPAAKEIKYFKRLKDN